MITITFWIGICKTHFQSEKKKKNFSMHERLTIIPKQILIVKARFLLIFASKDVNNYSFLYLDFFEPHC